MLRVALLGMSVGMWVLASCSCPRVESTTPDPGAGGLKLSFPTEVTVEPLKTGAESNKQHQALILGTKNGAVAIPLAGRHNEIEINPLSFMMRGKGQNTGFVGTVLLSTEPTGDVKKVRLGVYEQYTGGIGEQTRAATWIAAFMAASLLGKDMTDFRFSSESSGFRDGPSAGGLMTAGFLASMTGAEIDKTVTMTGTVNPDGTIGPVGGIPQKFKTGAESGKKKLGYPVGQRYDEDMNTGQMVDLKAVARENGAEAVEIADVYAAYELLTGKTLPRPEAIAESEMEVDDEVEKKISEKYDDWAKLYDRHEDEIIALHKAGNLPAGLLGLAVRAQEERKAAGKMRDQGVTTTAYYRIVRATVYAAAATSVAGILDKVAKADVKGAYALLDKELAVQDRTAGAIDKIGKLAPTTIGEHLMAISAYQAAVAGWGLQRWALDRIREELEYLNSLQGRSAADLASAQIRDELVEKIAAPILYLTRGEALARVAEESLEIEAIASLAWKCSIPSARALATSFSSAAAANTAYFESYFVKDLSTKSNKSEEFIKDRVMAMEPRYLVAYFAFQIGVNVAKDFNWDEDDIQMVLLTMSASIMSYLKSSSVISEYFSLGVQKDDRGRVSAVSKEKAFINMLTQAKEKAREHANAAKVATGQVPIQARIHYQNAKVLRDGSLQDKLDALEEFWWASAYSQVAVMLARN